MLLPPLGLTPSGRPLLLAGEVERMLLDKVDLEFEEGGGGVEGGECADRYKDGYAVLTTQRLMWLDAATGPGRPGRSCWVRLEAVASARRRSQLAFPAPKVRVEVRLWADASRRPVPPSSSSGGGGGSRVFAMAVLMLRCRGPAPDAFAAALEAAAAAATTAAAAAAMAAPPLPPPLHSHALPPGALALNPATDSLASGSFSVAAVGGGAAADQLRMAQMQYQQEQQQRQRRQQQPPPQNAAALLPPPSESFAREPDAAMLRGIVEMGFSRGQGARALLATGNEGVQQALDWILAFGGVEGGEGEGEERRGVAPMAADSPPDDRGNGNGNGGASAAASFPAAGAYAYAPPAVYQSAAAAAAARGGGGASSSSIAPPHHPRGAASSVDGGFANPLTAAATAGSHASRSAVAAPSHAARAPPPPPFPSSAVGVSGILQRQQARTAATGQSMDTAFRDLSALMAAAQEMVALAERFRGVSDGQEAAAAAADRGGGGSGGEGGEGGGAAAGAPPPSSSALVIDRETQLQLIALGIASPVTRESAGARYTLELARQLADFLLTPVAAAAAAAAAAAVPPSAASAAAAAKQPPPNPQDGLLSRAGGVMLLHDVYCLFNRARGVELVSPDDLIAACEAFGRAGEGAGGGAGSASAAAAAAAAAPASSLPIRLRRLPSGVLVLQSTAFSDEELCRRIQELVDYEVEDGVGSGEEEEGEDAEERRRWQRPQQRRRVAAGALGPPLFEADAARALRLPLALAREALRVAEQRGVLCRDEGGAEGLAFYRNFFVEA